MSIKRIHIDNSKDSAIESDKWEPNVKELVELSRNSSKPKTLLKEIFLIVPDDFDHSVVSEFKYPHHQIIDGKCVLDRKGVIAAYSRAKQQDIYDGDVKEHLDKHRKELGMIDEENRLNEAITDINTMFNSLQEAIGSQNFKSSMNRFSSMFEAPTSIGTVQPDQNTAQQQVAEPVQPPTIPVKNVDPSEDTSMNNPIEGPDDRDQDNLDGNQRKEMYQTFADTLMKANNKNVFGTIFDQDVFKSEYKIVPYEMRYFYRLQNPVSVEVGEFKFIPFGTDLLDAQDKYDLGKKMFVFATYNDKPVFFNMLDKTIWANDDKISDTFDGFIETMVQNNGEFIVPEDEDQQQQNIDANVEYEQNPSEQPAETQGGQPVDDSIGTQMELDQANQLPIDLTQNTSSPTEVNTGLDDQNGTATGSSDNMAPVDLTQQNASLEYDSVLDSMFESRLIDNYVKPDGSISRHMIADHIKDVKFTKNEFETLIDEINAKGGWTGGKRFSSKIPKEKWDEKYLSDLTFSDVFNEEYLRYLDKVARYIKWAKTPINASSIVDKYIIGRGRISYDKIVNDIASRKINRRELKELIHDLDELNIWKGRSFSAQQPPEDWDHAYLNRLVSYAIYGNTFNPDYLQHLYIVAANVNKSSNANTTKTTPPKSSDIGSKTNYIIDDDSMLDDTTKKLLAAAGGASLAGAIGYGLYKRHKKKKKAKNESFDDDIDDLFEEETSGCSRDAIKARKALEAEQEIDDMLESLNALTESVAFPNDELERRNSERQKERERRRYGEQMF